MKKNTDHLNQCKADQTFVWPFDVWLKNFLIPFIPQWIHPNHLTLTSFLWIFCACIASYLVVSLWNILWLWLIVLALFGHYITDLLDGELWRVRKAGYILWGFYMDHFTDYIFLVSIVGALYFVIPSFLQWRLIVLGFLISVLFVHLHLVTIVQDTFLISFHRFGPSEFRLFAVWAILFLMYFPIVWTYALPLILVLTLLIFLLAMYTTQKMLAKKDMENKYGYSKK